MEHTIVFKVTFYTLFVSAKCDTLEKEVEKFIYTLHIRIFNSNRISTN
jgi:hypothetical protein